jgi:glycosyltransferase involved in cell wall biosynthesis
MEETCLFSIIIPTFNRGWILRDALESIFAQGMPEVEVIVVDDGSTDDTKAVVGAYGSCVQYVYQENRGPAAAKNEGIRRARGRYMAFLDSDDVWLPGKLHTELEYFHAFPTADVVISNCESWVKNTLLSDSWLRDRFGERDLVLPSAPAFLPPHPSSWIRGKLFATCCMTLKRQVLHRLGREQFDVSLHSFEDWDFEIRLLRTSRVLILPEVLAKVRRFDDATRLDRPLPNQAYTPDQHRIAIHRRSRILEKTLAMGGWSEDELGQLHKAKRALAEQMARFCTVDSE